MSEKSAMGDRCAELKLRGAVLSVFSVVDTAYPESTERIVLVGLGAFDELPDETENLELDEPVELPEETENLVIRL
jgi:hypothetical protein